MQIKRHVPLNFALFMVAAMLWQSEAQAQTGRTKEAERSIGRDGKRRGGVSKRKHRRFRPNTRMRQRARLYEPYMAAAAKKYGVDPRVLWTLAYLETRFRPELVSPKNARGLMQFMPGTAARFNLKNPHNAAAAIDAAARYVRELTMQFDGRLDLVLAGYNAGEGAVECYRSGRSIRTSSGKVINPRRLRTSGVPPYAETRKYVRRGLLVFSRVTSARVFNPELIAATRVLQPPATSISVGDERVLDSELRALGGVQATVVYSGVKQTAVGTGPGNQAVSASKVETVFFDVNSGARYFVMNNQIVKPVETSAVGDETGGSSEARGQHRVTKSFYIGAGSE
jgi:Transglycosylase SLT domain